MRRVICLMVLLGIIGVISVLCFQRQNQPQTIMIDGVAWTQVLHWSFRDGLYPNSWGWGNWQIVDSELEGRESEGEFSVYFLPFIHGGDFILETRFRFLKGLDNDVEAQLLTRDSSEINSESGMVLFAEEDKVTVRHVADRIDYVYKAFPINVSIEYGEWFVMRLMIYKGIVKAFVNDVQIYGSNESFPVGEYREPHLAVRYGIARFEYLKVYVTNS